MRDFNVRTGQKCKGHYTGRTCDNKQCGGKLYDSIINFGENLNDEILTFGQTCGEKSDLVVALGSSLRVTPACDIVSDAGSNPDQQMVIINL